MGRSLKKDIFGTDVIRNGVGTNTGITVSGYFSSALNTDYSIVKQRGANTFVVARQFGMASAVTGNTTLGSKQITSVSTDPTDAQYEFSVGAAIHGVGIPVGSVIESIDSTSAITISNAATATGAGVALFYDGIRKVGKLVDTTPNANGEILMRGSPVSGTAGGELEGTSAGLVPIRKLTKRLAYGFPTVPVLSGGIHRGEDDNTATNHDGVRYTWYLESDSSADYIVLTQVS
jgi:hypothetical protein